MPLESCALADFVSRRIAHAPKPRIRCLRPVSSSASTRVCERRGPSCSVVRSGWTLDTRARVAGTRRTKADQVIARAFTMCGRIRQTSRAYSSMTPAISSAGRWHHWQALRESDKAGVIARVMNSPARNELNSIAERRVLQGRGYWPTDLTRKLTAWLFVQA